MVSEEQRIAIEKDIRVIYDIIKNNYDNINSKKELEQITGINYKKIEYYLKDYVARSYGIPESDILLGRAWLLKNKVKGLSNGGKTSQERHRFEKDEKGHFRGSGK